MTNTADRIKFDNEMKALAEGAYKENEKSVPKASRVQFFAQNCPRNFCINISFIVQSYG